MTDVRAVAAPELSAAELASRFGMARAGARPALLPYARDLWGRRHFVLAFARAYNAVGYSSSFLGQFWQVLTPLLNAGVYFLVFGVILHTRRGVSNYIGFLVIGIFVFHYTQNSILTGSRAITANIGLTRALHFPRATLPVATTVIALQQLLVSLVVLLPIILITGERPSPRWLLVVPAVTLQTIFCLGCSFVLARIGARIPDTAQILPFLLRTWLYLSGIFYSIKNLTQSLHGEWLRRLLEINPGAVYVELVRDALLAKHSTYVFEWPVAVAWATVMFLGGFVFFWQAEEEYGRG
ncbi:MAG: ABC transporter permease [Frankiaceae bacterium]